MGNTNDTLIKIDEIIILHGITTYDWIPMGVVLSIILYVIIAPLINWHFGYNKFHKEGLASHNLGCLSKETSTKNGFTLMYFFPALGGTIVYFSVGGSLKSKDSFYHILIASMVVIHFSKRVLETHFVHILTKPMAYSVAIGIAVAYTWVAIGSVMAAVNVKHDNDYVFYYVGIVLYIIGQLGNLYHHWLLAKSRKDENGEIKKEYVHPSKLGGCFNVSYVPHYYFEVCAWIGMCIASRLPVVWCSTFGMSWFLGTKGLKTQKWYKDENNFKTNVNETSPQA